MYKDLINIDRIKAESELIQSLIDTIPPQFYFDQDTKNRIKRAKHKAINAKLKTGTLKKGKTLSKQGLHKLAKFDPNINKTVTQIIEESDQLKCGSDSEASYEEEENKQMPKISDKKFLLKINKHKRKIPEDTQESSVNNESKKPKMDYESPQKNANLTKNALKLKISKQLEELKASRMPKESNLVKKARQKEKKLEKRNQKKAERKKLKKEILRKRLLEKQQKNHDVKQSSIQENENSTAQPSKPTSKKIKIQLNQPSNVKIITTKKAKFTGSNPRDVLIQVQKEKEKIKQIEQKNPEKASKLKEKQEWENALNKAKGIKVKDDEYLLKRAIQKKERQKKKSKKMWNERTERLQHRMNEKQRKRKENIQKRKDQKLQKKQKK